VRATTNDGWLPLHFTVQARRTNDDEFAPEELRDLVAFLVAQHPRSLSEATHGGYLPLHAAVSRGRSGIAFDDSVRQTEHDVVVFLLREMPAAVRMASRDGRFPVHCALLNALSVAPVRSLVEEWPESLLTRSIEGYSALHLAVMRDDHPLLDLVEFVMEQQPQLLHEADRDGSFPLHAAVVHNQPLDILQRLVRDRPDALEYADRTGALPLHVAAVRGGGDASLELIECLVRARPGTVRIRDGRGRLPLHAAALHNAPLDVQYWLVRTWPEAIREG
jgi:ankyrin repeat protein